MSVCHGCPRCPAACAARGSILPLAPVRAHRTASDASPHRVFSWKRHSRDRRGAPVRITPGARRFDEPAIGTLDPPAFAHLPNDDADVPVLIRTQVHRPRAVRVHAQASTPGAAPAFGRKLGSAAGSGFARGSQGTSFSVLSNTLTLSRLNPRQRRRAGLARPEPFFPKKPVLTTPQHPNHTYSGTSGFVSHRRVVKVRPDSRSITSANPNLKRPRTKTKRK